MIEIALGDSKVALIDDEDWCKVWMYSWSVSTGKRSGYARTTMRKQGKNYSVYMHKLIMGNPESAVDHKDHDILNNQKHNLRLATDAQNKANCLPYGGKLHKGIWYNGKKWVSRIEVNQVGIYLGTFNTIEEAKAAYDRAAILAFGEFAYTNEMHSSMVPRKPSLDV